MGEKLLIYNGDNLIAAIQEEGYERDINHKYLVFEKSPPPGFITDGSMILIEKYLPEIQQSLKDWRSDNRLFQVNWTDPKSGKPKISSKINYKIISEELRTRATFDESKYNLPVIFSGWLDRSLDVSINYHVADKSGETLQMIDGNLIQEYGDKFPLKPTLDREGHIFTTFNPQLIKRIIFQRKQLIENSNLALKHNWIFELRSLINDTISLVDITLHQLYTKAEFFPEQGWTFDKKKLGPKTGRIKDKLHWVRQISGVELYIEKEFKCFDNLRKVRNHFNHFDPPTLVITLEEASRWLNEILYVGKMLIKMRQALKTPVCNSLVELTCQKLAKFNPEKGFLIRSKLDSRKAGYESSTWMKDEEE